MDDLRLMVNRVSAFLIVILVLTWDAARFFPVVVTMESCTPDAPASQVFLCLGNFDAVYSTSYSWFNLSTTYDPWPSWWSIAPNGRSILFYPAGLAAIVWAVLALRRRARRSRMLVGAGLAIGLIAAVVVVNLLQVPRFRAQWTHETCGRGDWCSTSTAWGLRTTILLTVFLVVALLCSAGTLERDGPSSGRLGSRIRVGSRRHPPRADHQVA